MQPRQQPRQNVSLVKFIWSITGQKARVRRESRTQASDSRARYFGEHRTESGHNLEEWEYNWCAGEFHCCEEAMGYTTSVMGIPLE